MSIIGRSNIFDPFSLDLWDSFLGFPFNAVSAAPPSNSMSETSAFANARIDWKETPEAHVFKADLPGVKKEEVKVEVEDGRLIQISGQRSKEHEEKTDKWHRVERSSGKFMRRFRLPENVKVDHINASIENGVLTVTVPKEEVTKPEMKPIEISGSDTTATESGQAHGQQTITEGGHGHGHGQQNITEGGDGSKVNSPQGNGATATTGEGVTRNTLPAKETAHEKDATGSYTGEKKDHTGSVLHQAGDKMKGVAETMKSKLGMTGDKNTTASTE